MSEAVTIPDAAAEAKKPASRMPFSRGFIYTVIGILVFVLLSIMGPITGGIRYAPHNMAMQQAREIGTDLVAFAEDNAQHGNAYPDGNSSTEVFQKLLDGHYINQDDPAIFYVPLPGKIPGVRGQKLKPENVCWDVTLGVDSRSSNVVPLVFMTGYRISYTSGGTAVPVIKPYPPFWVRTWSEWWHSIPNPHPDAGTSGIAVFYQSYSARFLKLQANSNGEFSVPNFTPLDFKPDDGKTYRQLSPDGPLP